MKLSDNDYVEAVYYTNSTSDQTIEYKNKNVELNRLKLGKRDTKGVKIRV